MARTHVWPGWKLLVKGKWSSGRLHSVDRAPIPIRYSPPVIPCFFFCFFFAGTEVARKMGALCRPPCPEICWFQKGRFLQAQQVWFHLWDQRVAPEIKRARDDHIPTSQRIKGGWLGFRDEQMSMGWPFTHFPDRTVANWRYSTSRNPGWTLGLSGFLVSFCGPLGPLGDVPLQLQALDARAMRDKLAALPKRRRGRGDRVGFGGVCLFPLGRISCIDLVISWQF